MMNFKNSLILLSLFVSVSATAVVMPADDLIGAPVNDPFIVYQWPLFNHGQTLISDLDDTHPIKTVANPKLTINWKNFDSMMKRDVIVAVADSGVDVDHPELKGRLLPGVNVLTTRPELRKLVDDDLGHGTHMASILAAISNNNEGMAGLSNRIKILPLKFYDKAEATPKSGAGGNRRSLTDRIVEVLDIAIEQKADVINMSIGWPRVGNSEKMEAAFKRAIDAGLIIVVGAGNDHHDAPIYPCAFAGVICVGAMSMDGELADFSNFGGHVDLLAPGQAILGLWPMTLISKQFGPKGYDIKSGTSQATPIVAGAAAILRGIYPKESSAQIRQRLLASATRVFPQVNFGLLNIMAAVEITNPKLTAPVFKGIELAVVDPATRQFDLPVVIESSQPLSLDVKVESLSPSVTLTKLESESSANVAIRKYKVRALLSDLGADNRLRYRVIIGNQSYEHQILMVTDVRKLPHEIAPPIDGKIAQVSDPRGHRQVEFWSSEELKEGGLKLKLWRLENGTWIFKEVTLSGVDKVYNGGLGLTAGDWNLNGREGYLFAGIAYEKAAPGADKTPKEIRFYYLDRDMRVERDLPLASDSALPAFKNPRDIVLGRVSDGKGGHLKVPVFWSNATIPDLDLNPDKFAFEKNRQQKRLYYLQPRHENGETQLTTRTLTAWQLDRFVRETLAIDATQDVEVVGIKTQNLNDLASGRLRLVIFVGRLTQGKTYELIIDDMQEGFKAANLTALSTSFSLKGGAFEEALKLDGQHVDRGTEVQSLYSFISGRSLLEEGAGFRELKLNIKLTGEKILSTLKTYVRGADQVSMLETTDYLRAQGRWFGKDVDSQVAVYRSSFLPGSIFSQVFTPVLVGRDQRPAIMMDNTLFFSRSVSVYALNPSGELRASVGLSYSIPDGCSPLPFSYWNQQGFSRIIFRCVGGDSAGHMMLIDLL